MVAEGFKGQATTQINFDQIDATPQYPVGSKVTSGDATYRYVKFVDAVTYKAYDCVTLASATTWDVTNDRAGGSALAGQMPVGFLLNYTTMPTANTYGWVKTSGIHSFTAGSAAIIAGDYLMPDTTEDGDCTEAAAGTDENICAVALATVADNAVGACFIAIRGG